MLRITPRKSLELASKIRTKMKKEWGRNMNVLILSSQFGMGHQMAAKAIGEEILKLDKDANVIELDLLRYYYPKASRYIFRLFQMMVEHCYGIYNLVYKTTGKLKVDLKPMGINLYRKLEKLMEDHYPDMIVCTLPLCAKSIASYMEKTGKHIPLVTCITDISIHPEWITPQADAYLAPTKEVKENLVRNGASPEQIFVTGIPVRQQFLGEVPMRDKGQKKILIMGGGLGIIPNLDRLMQMIHRMPGITATVITGKNRKAYEAFQGRYEDIEVLGYTENISKYMKEADLVITKAGGITLFELIHCQVPLFVIHPFLEQEVNNARYAQNMGIAKVIWNKSSDFPGILEKFLSDGRQWEQMAENISKAKDEIMEWNLDDAMNTVMERMAA